MQHEFATCPLREDSQRPNLTEVPTPLIGGDWPLPAYVIVNIDVRDAVQYEDYKRLADRTVQTYGGRYLVRGGKVEVLEGSWDPRRVVVEFPTAAQAKAWWSSPEYSHPKTLRHAISHTDMFIVEGV